MKATGKRMQAEETNEEGLNNGNGSPKFIKLKPSPIIRKVSTEEGKEEEPEGRKRKLSLTSNPIMVYCIYNIHITIYIYIYTIYSHHWRKGRRD